MYTGTEIPVTTPFLIWFIGLFLGILGLGVPYLKLISIQRRILKLFRQRYPELYKTLLEPRQFKSLGMPNTLFGFPMWPADSWRQTKFFLSRECKIEDREICRLRERARRVLTIYLVGFVMWILAFVLMIVVYFM